MKREHEMPFGAECRGNGTVRFRLWAPEVRTVTLQLTNPMRELPMSRVDGGCFELITSAEPGVQYAFQLRDNLVPDPASRFQPSGVHRASEVIDPLAFDWQDSKWKGRCWDEAVIYELHVGAFSAEGTFAGVEAKLDYLASLGVTAIELMPVADFPGERNWGYDGVLPFAPARCYGRPDDLKRLVDAAHAKGLMVFLDVVYNHLGPEGNYLTLYAPEFFTARHQTPWGPAINFDGPDSRPVRDFFIHNALYWLEEYHFDGLRFDAVHAIHDDSQPDFLTELAETVRKRFEGERRVHLVLENDDNSRRYLRRNKHGPIWYTAQWNDDIHHALHVLVTNETDGYYSDYAQNRMWHLGRCLAEGYSFQGDESAFRDGARRGDASRDLPPTCFVSFLQNHDQIGNRALGERINRIADADTLRVAMAILLLAPSPPLLFMGEEFDADTPFLFFCDFAPELAEKVTSGRRSEFAKFAQFSSPQGQAQIPDPNAKETFLRSKLDWNSAEQERHCNWLKFYRDLLKRRSEQVVPRISDIAPGRAEFEVMRQLGLYVRWSFKKSGSLQLFANFDHKPLALNRKPDGELLYATTYTRDMGWKEIPPLTAAWFLSA
ncbi:MAG TPA: malto-oligosyltrehalose trehalohydrolase [Terriglobales bacterium]|jgi:malto-oligosyltrehalose trehalohydrolase|nr:malto-oligosyltrehalose trehalohydrolase [Terriglobales bacterium]